MKLSLRKKAQETAPQPGTVEWEWLRNRIELALLERVWSARGELGADEYIDPYEVEGFVSTYWEEYEYADSPTLTLDRSLVEEMIKDVLGNLVSARWVSLEDIDYEPLIEEE